jgi:hypothetical protein
MIIEVAKLAIPPQCPFISEPIFKRCELSLDRGDPGHATKIPDDRLFRGLRDGFLREIGYTEILPPLDRAAILGLLSRKNPEQRRFSDSVRTDESEFLSLGDGKIRPEKHFHGSVPFMNVPDSQHTGISIKYFVFCMTYEKK